MKKILFALFFVFVSSCQLSPYRDVASKSFGKKSEKNALRAVTEEERNQYISRAQIFDPNYSAEKVAQTNFIQDLQGICGPGYSYKKIDIRDNTEYFNRTKVSYDWPTIDCTYKPDNEKKMSGGSSKFLCNFQDSTDKDGFVTRKVKYANYPNDPLRSEVVETTVAFILAKLIGFYTNNYCPTVINCVNCPNSTPWNSDRASAGPSKHSYKIEWSIVERPIDAYVISTPNSGNAARGVEWEEIKQISADNDEDRKRMLIEREAWILWIHFLQHTDAAGFNQRLGCTEAEETNDKKILCKKPILYTHDYGHAFYRHMNFYKWANESVFQKSNGNGCKAVLRKDYIPSQSPLKGIILDAVISSEARDLLVSRLSQISDSQWTELFLFARGEEAVTNTTANDWLKAIKKKINQLKSGECLPFSSGKSVLAR